MSPINFGQMSNPDNSENYKSFLDTQLGPLSNHIGAKKALEYNKNKELVGIDGKFDFKSPQALEVLEGLRFIVIRSRDDDVKLSPEQQGQLDVVRNLCDEIIMKNENVGDLFNEAPKDVIQLILSETTVVDAERFRRVQKKWDRAVPSAQIQQINKSQISMKDALPGKSAKEALAWLKANPQ